MISLKKITKDQSRDTGMAVVLLLLLMGICVEAERRVPSGGDPLARREMVVPQSLSGRWPWSG